MKRLGLVLLFSLLIGAASAQLGGGFMFPGPGMPASAGGGGRTCTDDTASTNFLTRTGGSAPNYGAGSARYADAICTFIKALETASIITGTLGGTSTCGATATTGKFDGLYLLKAHTKANALLNVCGTSFSILEIGTPTFTADTGYVGAASAALNTQFDPTAGTGNFTQNSAAIWGHTSTNFVSGTDYGSMGANGSGTTAIRLYAHFTDNNLYARINQTTGFVPLTSQGHQFLGASRTSSTNTDIYADTTATVDTFPSAAPVGPTIVFLADSNTGAAPFAGTMTFAAMGSSLNSTQEAALQSAVAAYVASVP